MASFTQGKNGEWSYKKDEMHPFYYVIPEGSSRFVASVDKEANAKLIAATPEMYRLLKECADELKAIGLPTLSRECYELLNRINGRR